MKVVNQKNGIDKKGPVLTIKVGINCLLTQANIESYFDLAQWCIERNIEIKLSLHL